MSFLEELKEELEEIFNISNTTTEHLEYEIIGPRIISAKKIQKEERKELMVNTCYYWVMVDQHFEKLTVILKL